MGNERKRCSGCTAAGLVRQDSGDMLFRNCAQADSSSNMVPGLSGNTQVSPGNDTCINPTKFEAGKPVVWTVVYRTQKV